MAHAAPSSGSSSSGRHAQPDQPDQGHPDEGRSGLPTGPSGVPQRVHLPERGTAENTVGWLTAVIGAASIGVVIAIIVVLIIGVVQRG